MLAGALEFEEWRSGYLSNQVAKMHMIRYDMLDARCASFL